jgi:hypothetical protein
VVAPAAGSIAGTGAGAGAAAADGKVDAVDVDAHYAAVAASARLKGLSVPPSAAAPAADAGTDNNNDDDDILH